jgi:uncharacterized membrane protein
MEKKYGILIALILLISAALFYDQILAAFSGMSVIESLKFIVTFVLHVTVGTICAYVLFGLPKIIAPWVRMLRLKRKAARKTQRAQGRRQSQTTPQRAPTTSRVMGYLLNQLGYVEKKPTGQPRAQEPASHIKLDM